jgi:putative transposase
VIVRFISEHKGVFGVEPICRVLTEHGCQIAPSTYYDAARRAPSARAVRDEQLKAAISRVHAANYGATERVRSGSSRTGRAPRWPGAPWSG